MILHVKAEPCEWLVENAPMVMDRSLDGMAIVQAAMHHMSSCHRCKVFAAQLAVAFLKGLEDREGAVSLVPKS